MGDLFLDSFNTDLFYQPPVNLDCLKEMIKSQADQLANKACIIYEEFYVDTKDIYRANFSTSKDLFDKYKENQCHILPRNILKYSPLNVATEKFFFGIVQSDGQYSYCISDQTFARVFMIHDKDVFHTLNILEDSDYGLLIIREFFYIRKYYKVIPELILLESIICTTSICWKYILLYLRSLNVYLTHCIENNQVIPAFREKIIQFIEILAVRVTPMPNSSSSFYLLF